MTADVLGASAFTLLGVLITIAAGFVTLKRQIAGEIRRVRYEIIQSYAERLEDARLTHYPDLYRTLSDAIKVLDYPDAHPEGLDLARLESEVNAWDSARGVLLSAESGERAVSLRALLRRQARRSGAPLLTDLRPSLAALEVALRVDLGVYALEFANIERNFRRFGSIPPEESRSPGVAD